MPSQFQPYQYTAIPNPEKHPKGSKGVLALIITLVVLACLGLFAVGIAGCATIASVVESDGSTQSTSTSSQSGSSDSTSAGAGNANLRSVLGEGSSIDNFTKSELEELQEKYFASAKATGDNTPQGIYFVGEKKGLKAGTYWMGGSDTQLSYYFVLTKSGNTYNCKLNNNYYGHNLITVNDSEVLIVINGTKGFCDISKMTDTFSDPYTNGVFRVGTDIPAGTYRLKAGKDSSTYYAYYVMKDLSYEGDYITEEKQTSDANTFSTYTVTLHEGEYLELFNATATKGSQA